MNVARRTLLALLLLGTTATWSAAQDDLRATALIGMARVKKDAGDLAAAAKYWEQARAERRLTTPELTEYFWVVQGSDGRSALQLAREILRTAPKTDAVRDAAIGLAVDLDDETSVIALAEEGRLLNDASAHWPRLAGDSFMRRGRPGDAATAYGAAVERKDATPDDWAAFAVALTGAERYAEAVAAWGHVPPTALVDRADLSRLRLQAFTYGATDKSAATELEAWLADNPGDEVVRSWLVDLWVRAGAPAKAYLAAQPLTTGSEPVRWLRRSAQLAQAASMPDRALAALASLVSTGHATKADRLEFAGLALAAGDETRALTVLDEAAASMTVCEDAVLTIIDRVPGSRGTDRLVSSVQRLGCADSPWGRRAVERAVAEARHPEALRIVQAMRTRPADMRRLEGLLLLWTNAPAAALPILKPLVAERPDDVEVRMALIDAYRMTAEPYEAFRAAQPLFGDATLSVPRQIVLAELSLEADQPSIALAIANRVPAPAAIREGAAIRGRALLALGRPADARTVFDSVLTADFNPPAALAAIDAVLATSGAAEAQKTGERFPTVAGPWVDVAARRLMLAQSLGDTPGATALRAELCPGAPTACAVADAETQLFLEQPLTALLALKDIEPPTTADQVRIDDLRSIALEGAGQYVEAQAILRRLRARSPSRVAWATRETVVAWRIARDAASLAAVANLAREYPDDSYARVAAARVLNLAGQSKDAVRVLTEPGAPPVPPDGRIVLAEALRTTGDPSGALAALDDTPLATEHAAMLKSELQAVVQGPAAAIETLREWTKRPVVPEAIYLAWSALEQPGAPRVAVLQEASTRIPDSGRLAAQLANERLVAGDFAGARLDAERALILDPLFPPSWFAVVDATYAIGNDRDMADLLDRLRNEAETNAGLVISVADHVSGLVHEQPFDLARQLVGVLRSLSEKQAPGIARHMAVARLEAALEEWEPALRAVDAARQQEPKSPQVLRLRADILSWAGRHVEAVEAYSKYLEVEPDNLDARRQQARVAGWGGRYAQSRRFYEGLRDRYPSDAAVAAEANAKIAFYDARWQAAVGYYDAWIAVEPSNSEARFERAAALRSAGHSDESDTALQDLVSSTGHRLAAAALQRNFDARRPVFAYTSSASTANGYAGQRLLDMHRDGGSVNLTLGKSARMRVNASVEQVRVSSDTRALNGYRGGVQGMYLVGPRLAVDARAGLWTFDARNTFEAQARGVWTATERVVVEGGLNLEPIQENLTTVEQGLTAAGPFARVRAATPNTTLDVRAAWQRVSDGNTRTRLTASASRMVSESLRGLRLVGWAETLEYSFGASSYFSPDFFLRVDGGVEYTHLLQRPRFEGDRRRTLQVSFLEGTDNHGVLYHHPSVGAGFELSRWFTVNGTASWIRSAVYRDSLFSVDVRVTGATDGR